jgi:hypothetical protein
MEIYFIDQSSIFKDFEFVTRMTSSKRHKKLMYFIFKSRLAQAVQFIQQQLITEPNDPEYLTEIKKI